jgi:HK97 family phage major capsid protein
MTVSYNDVIGRSTYLLPDEFSKEIIQALPTSSFCMKMMRKLPDMNAKTYKIPVMSTFPSAYFVGETVQNTRAIKATTKMAWTGVTLTAEELAVIVPVPENVIDDMASGGYDLWGEVKPRLVEAIGAKVDSAILFSDAQDIAPTSWPDGIVTQAIEKGSVVDVSDQVGATKDFADLAGAILADNGLFSKVEQSGYIVNGAMGAVSMMGKLRGLRTTDGQFIFMNDMRAPNDYRLAGVPLTFPNNGAFDSTKALLVVGDFSQAVYAIRKDITFKVATEASIHDDNGLLQYNLFQDDMVALRVTMRMGWQLPNPVTLMKGSSGLPFAALVP